MGADVALKTIPFGRPDFVYRLKREFRALADLHHENLVAYYELFADHEACFFTMEYVPGGTFIDFVRPAGRLDEARLRRGLDQLARGLTALHDAGKLHRDIKPSNVLVGDDGRLVLLDFSLATQLEVSGLSRSAELAGTPEFMSPKHALGESVSAASDWYGVGVMLYQALTGRLPFWGTWAQLVEMKLHPVELQSPSRLCPGLDPRLVELTMALLSPDPTQRPGAAELHRLMDASGGSGRAATPKHTTHEIRLVGRAAELGRLREALRATRLSKSACVLVEGASGVGKTTLVKSFLSWAERSEGAVIFLGRCYERERVPYQGIDSLVDDLCRFLKSLGASEVESLLLRHMPALVQLFPVLERVPAIAGHRSRPAPAPDQQELRRQAFLALRELLARAADRCQLDCMSMISSGVISIRRRCSRSSCSSSATAGGSRRNNRLLN